MPRDILSEYGPDSPSREQPRATNGGQIDPKPLPYSPPVGPSNINDPKTPGIHGTNHGNSCNQGRH
jgi:hypothetical protein